MGLFGKAADNEKFTEIEQIYKRITAWKGQDEELVAMIDDFIALCKSLTSAEVAQFDKTVKKQSKRNRSIDSYDHPVYGFFFGHDNIINDLINTVQGKKRLVEKAIAKKEEFANIEEVTPTIDNESVLERRKLSEMPEIKIQNITKSFDKETKIPSFVVVDLETTGLKPSSDRIVQVSALRYDYFEPTEAFVSYVNPGRPIPEDASKVNGLTDEDVKDAPSLSAIAVSLQEFIGASPIVGFNTSFDLQFLFCSGIDLITKRKIYDAKALAKKVYKGDMDYYSLENVLAMQGIHIKELHDAKVDCYATGMAFLNMIDEITS